MDEGGIVKLGAKEIVEVVRAVSASLPEACGVSGVEDKLSVAVGTVEG